MSLALNDTLSRFHAVRAEARSHLRNGGDVMAEAADKAMKLAGRSNWPRVAGAAALGFVIGVAALGGRKAVMQAVTGVAGDWFAALKADHKLVDGLFALLTATTEDEVGKRHLLISKIAYALAKHQFEEEHVVYPTLLEDGPASTPKHLDAEHFEMKSFIHELMSMAKDDPQWLAKAKSLHRLIQAHVREEEEIVFPRLHERLSTKQNVELTRALHREGLKLA